VTRAPHPAAVLARVTVSRSGRVILHDSAGDLQLGAETPGGAALAFSGEREDRVLSPAPSPIQLGAT
jgi:hypothetical protein